MKDKKTGTVWYGIWYVELSWMKEMKENGHCHCLLSAGHARCQVSQTYGS
jgi:hypothetical protein